ncbi:MAG TPA: nicotinate-nucleotide adenylyltransferase [Vicinamibacterales bacterium]|nr:nicotinate-nucleotide adenylyltransferase [Vicinamibacterales bacterium]
MTRLGLLGGTFDPIHQGHLDVAEAARRALGLTTVWLMPARIPPHRRAPRASAPHRFAMAALAAQTCEDFQVSDVEMTDPGELSPSYTEATLDRLSGRGLDTREIFFITGADAFRDIRTWKGFPGILDRCHFVAVSRPGQPVSGLRSILPELAERMLDAPGPPPARPAIFLVDAPTASVSSTLIRERIAGGESIEGMVPREVAAHIEKHGLYKD